jgi:hypothetical protein
MLGAYQSEPLLEQPLSKLLELLSQLLELLS